MQGSGPEFLPLVAEAPNEDSHEIAGEEEGHIKRAGLPLLRCGGPLLGLLGLLGRLRALLPLPTHFGVGVGVGIGVGVGGARLCQSEDAGEEELEDLETQVVLAAGRRAVQALCTGAGLGIGGLKKKQGFRKRAVEGADVRAGER